MQRNQLAEPTDANASRVLGEAGAACAPVAARRVDAIRLCAACRYAGGTLLNVCLAVVTCPTVVADDAAARLAAPLHVAATVALVLATVAVETVRTICSYILYNCDTVSRQNDMHLLKYYL